MIWRLQLDKRETVIKESEGRINNMELKVSEKVIENEKLQKELKRKELVTCDICGKDSNGSNEFKAHKKTLHCNLILNSNTDLAVPVSESSGEMEEYKCTGCEYTTMSKASINLHTFECNSLLYDCGLWLKTPGLLRRHIRKEH